MWATWRRRSVGRRVDAEGVGDVLTVRPRLHQPGRRHRGGAHRRPEPRELRPRRNVDRGRRRVAGRPSRHHASSSAGGRAAASAAASSTDAAAPSSSSADGGGERVASVAARMGDLVGPAEMGDLVGDRPTRRRRRGPPLRRRSSSATRSSSTSLSAARSASRAATSAIRSSVAVDSETIKRARLFRDQRHRSIGRVTQSTGGACHVVKRWRSAVQRLRFVVDPSSRPASGLRGRGTQREESRCLISRSTPGQKFTSVVGSCSACCASR